MMVEEIERLRIEKNFNYIDAIIYWSEINNVDIDLIAELIKKDSILKGKIEIEAEELNIIRKEGNRLPA